MKYPVIATRGIVVFPGQSALIEIGRVMSLNAVDLSVIQNEAKVIIVSQKDVMKNNIESQKDLYEIGTLATIKIEKQVKEHKTISAHGIERVKLDSIDLNDGQLIEAESTIIKSRSYPSKKETEFVEAISKKLEDSMSQMMNIPGNILKTLADGISASDLADVIAHYVPLSLDKKQILLETVNVNKRLELINKYLVDQKQITEVDKNIDSQVRSTLDAQQKEYLLREKMKAIKEELGDVTGKGNEIDIWREKLKDKKYPKEVRETALEEIAKFEAMPPISAEAHVSKGYIDWIMKLPWRTYSKDSEDLDKAKAILNKNHFGLKKVKERIIEHLAVKINTKSSSAPILTLVGPPGVGKTSLGQSIADSVGREFIKVSLGGVRDEAEIRGHRRTYVGAMPGKIIQALNKAKTSNPIILLDEIDKMASDFKGDPSSAMLEVLDPEQNKNFQDHYLELEYDLSHVMFIGTANYYDKIPEPLKDRVETIWLDQYTSEEKISIAKDYLIPKVLKDNGLSNASYKITEDVILFIINKYTQEAGVRGLQRVLSKIARKIVVMKIEGQVKSAYTVTKENAKELLGNQQVYKEILKGKAEVGLTNGMYYSTVGGGVLPIEVSTYPSKNGGVKLTGSIKDVMKESLNVAIGYLRTNSKSMGIDFNWEGNTIQVHVPEGATPKDGPSAGIAFTTAVLSALTGKAIPRDVAFTGEITLRGRVLMIGGLKEKTLGAVEAGVRKIFIPETNKKDLQDLAKKVKELATIIPVSHYSQVYKELFK